VNLAIGEHRHEGAAEQFVVTGIAAQRGAVIGRRGGDVALTASVPSGEIAARRGGPGKAVARLRLRPSRHQSRPSYGECSQCGYHRTKQDWRRDHGSSTPSGGRTAVARPHLAEWTVRAQPRTTSPIEHVHSTLHPGTRPQ